MSEVFEHNPGDHEDPLPGPTWLIGILSAVLLSVVVLGVTAIFFNADTRMVDAKVVDADYPQVDAMREAQLAAIEGPARKKEVLENDQKVTNIVIPIDLAMQKYAAQVAQQNEPQVP
jgi:hypothetical protein